MTLSVQAFSERAVAHLRMLGEARPMRFDGVRNCLVVGDGPQVTYVSLRHAYHEGSHTSGPMLDAVLNRRLWTVPLREGPPPVDVLLRAVMPRLKDRAWFSALRRQAELELGANQHAIDDAMPPFQPVNDELAVHLVFELPTSVMELGNDRLRAWNAPFPELLERAMGNLRARTTQPLEARQPGVFASPFRDSFDASRMLLTEWFQGLAVKGAPVALAPAHDTLFVTGDADSAGLSAIAGWAEEAVLDQKPHSAVAFRLEGAHWVPWLPPVGHEAFGKLKLLRLQTVASAYARQKEVLDALLQSNGHQLHDANLRAFRTADGDIFTSTTWTDGVDALLPQTDRIEFMRLPPDGSHERSSVWSTRWDLAVRTLGPMMQPTGDVPERWRVSGFPSDQQLERLASDGKL